MTLNHLSCWRGTTLWAWFYWKRRAGCHLRNSEKVTNAGLSQNEGAYLKDLKDVSFDAEN